MFVSARRLLVESRNVFGGEHGRLSRIKRVDRR